MLERIAQVSIRLGRGLREHNAFSTASAMAFNFFLSFIPLLVLAGFVLGQLVRKRGVEPLMEPFLDALPAAAAQIVQRELEGMAGAGSTPAAPLSVIGFLMVASTGTHHLMDVFEVAVQAKRRPWWQQRAIALVWLLAMLGALSGSAWLLLSVDADFHRDEIRARSLANATPTPAPSLPSTPPNAARPRVRTNADTLAPVPKTVSVKHRPFFVRHAIWEKGVALTALLLVILTGLALLYRFAVQHPAGVRRRVWPGAALALAAWFVVSYVFGAYAATLASYTDYYGSLAAVAVVLVWLYLTSLSLLLGAELNSQLEGVRVLD